MDIDFLRSGYSNFRRSRAPEKEVEASLISAPELHDHSDYDQRTWYVLPAVRICAPERRARGRTCGRFVKTQLITVKVQKTQNEIFPLVERERTNRFSRSLIVSISTRVSIPLLSKSSRRSSLITLCVCLCSRCVCTLNKRNTCSVHRKDLTSGSLSSTIWCLYIYALSSASELSTKLLD